MGLQNPHRRFDSAPRLQLSIRFSLPSTFDLKFLHSALPSARLPIAIRVVSRAPPQGSAVILKPLNSILLLAAVQAACLFGPSCVAAQRPGPAPQTPRATQLDAATGTAARLVTIRDDKKGELSYSAKV